MISTSPFRVPVTQKWVVHAFRYDVLPNDPGIARHDTVRISFTWPDNGGAGLISQTTINYGDLDKFELGAQRGAVLRYDVDGKFILS